MLDLLFNTFLLLLTFYALARIVDVFFIETLELISKKLKLSSDVAGATFMALGSSAPELFVSLFAVLRPVASEQAIGAGAIVGSAIFNILVIVGASALYRRAVLTWQPVVRDLAFYTFTILVLLFTFRDGQITLTDSVVFVSLYILYVLSFGMWKKLFPYTLKHEGDDTDESVNDVRSENLKLSNSFDKFLSLFFFDLKRRPSMMFFNFIVAIAALAGFSHIMVESAVHVAHFFNIPEVIIGLTILAAGTSVPDLLSSIAVAKKGKGDMAVANAVGSNVFDINIGLGLPWLIFILWKGEEIAVVTENLNSSIVLLFATVTALLFLLIARKWELGRYAGILLIGSYVFYLLNQIGLFDTTFCVNVLGTHCLAL